MAQPKSIHALCLPSILHHSKNPVFNQNKLNKGGKNNNNNNQHDRNLRLSVFTLPPSQKNTPTFCFHRQRGSSGYTRRSDRRSRFGEPELGMEVGTTPTKPRKVMVVADPTRESSAAVQYALSHGVVERDELILLHVENAISWRNTLSTLFRRSSLNATGISSDGAGGRSLNESIGRGLFIINRSIDGGGGMEVDYLEEMKRLCEISQPKVRVRVERVEMDQNKDCKASAILSACTSHGVDVLVIGQRRNLSQAILGYRRPGSSNRGTRVTDTAEYLIENCRCTCVGVQRKGQNAGYLLTTKTCRNFWLLA